jgi:hypothetical protein
MYTRGQQIEYSNGQTAKVIAVREGTGFFALLNAEGLYAHCQRDLTKTDEEVWSFIDEANPWIPQWKFEFGSFPVADMPAIPAGWDDVSWHNDMSPCFENEAAGWRLWVQWADPKEREFEDMPRFSLCPTDDRAWEDSHTGFETWEQVLEFLARFPTLQAFENSTPAKG